MEVGATPIGDHGDERALSEPGASLVRTMCRNVQKSDKKSLEICENREIFVPSRHEDKEVLGDRAVEAHGRADGDNAWMLPVGGEEGTTNRGICDEQRQCLQPS